MMKYVNVYICKNLHTMLSSLPSYKISDCGEEDVYAGDSDMYWSLYYITPFRQLRTQFTLPYKPPANGALTMYGIGEGVKDFEDLIAQQKEGTQGPICLGTSTAYANYLTAAFPDLKHVGIPNTDEGALNGMLFSYYMLHYWIDVLMVALTTFYYILLLVLFV